MSKIILEPLISSIFVLELDWLLGLLIIESGVLIVLNVPPIIIELEQSWVSPILAVLIPSSADCFSNKIIELVALTGWKIASVDGFLKL